MRSLQYFPDTVLVYSVQSNPRKYLYLFSNKGELLNILVQIRQGQQWVNESIETRTYDAQSNMILQQWQSWTGNAWVNASRNLLTYNDNHKILTHTQQNWNATLGQWVNFRRTTNVWSLSGLQLTMLQEIFSGGNWENQVFELYIWENNNLVQAERQNWVSGNWTNAYQYLYSYNGQGNLTSMTIRQWAGNQWNDSYKEVYSYNTANQLIIYVSQLFNNGWQNSEQYFYTYDVLGFPESVVRQVWQSGTWQNNLQRLFTNNNYGTVQLALHQVWQQNSWLNQHMFTKGFDENGNTTLSNAFVWSGGWQQNQDDQLEVSYNFGLKTFRFTGYKAEAGYTSMIVGQNETRRTTSYLVSPNPSNGKIFIFNELLASTVARVSIFALDGKEVFNTKYASGSPIVVDVSNQGLKPGVYVLRITSSNESYHQNIIIR
ncbi:MAG TPA: T9SS type A sorting domain-containing protein [Bacteroidales bacterium]|nr:T9SS type A sorting domain-containing protein [Bacteroidales bacterium]